MSTCNMLSAFLKSPFHGTMTIKWKNQMELHREAKARKLTQRITAVNWDAYQIMTIDNTKDVALPNLPRTSFIIK